MVPFALKLSGEIVERQSEKEGRDRETDGKGRDRAKGRRAREQGY